MNPNERISLSVFMPFYNEEGNVEKVILEAESFLKKNDKISKFEIIIVNDGSTDSTKQVAQELVNKYQNVRLITHEKNMGYGAALISGIRNSIHDYVFFMDGDLQLAIERSAKILLSEASIQSYGKY